MNYLFQYYMPQQLLSKISFLLANSNIPWLKNFLIRDFLSRYEVNLKEAKESNPFAYESFNHFFTRHLLDDARPIARETGSITSPADGMISHFGEIKQGTLIQAKGHYFKAHDLLGGTEGFEYGHFMTVYLAPKDYHRVHMPFQGQLEKIIYIPGKLFSVCPHTAENIPNLFARNERVVCLFNTAVGKMAVVLVGAMIVGSIETVWTGTIPRKKQIQVWSSENLTELHRSSLLVNKGGEVGCFKLGSTVIILFENKSIVWKNNLQLQQPIQMGQSIAEINL